MQCERLLRIPRLDSKCVRLVHPRDGAFLFVEIAHGRGRAVFQHIEVVVLLGVAQRRHLAALAVHVHSADDVTIDVLERGLAREHVPVVLDLAGLVILCRQIQRLGFQPEVDVLGHQDHFGIRLLGLQAQRRVKDLVVVRAFGEHGVGHGPSTIVVHDNFQRPRWPLSREPSRALHGPESACPTTGCMPVPRNVWTRSPL